MHTMMRIVALLALVLGTAVANVVVNPGAHQTTYASMQARFGGDISKTGLVGTLYVAEPSIYACDTVTPPGNTSANAILLVSRGPPDDSTCEFGTKAKIAQDAGYTAIVVFNDQGNDLIAMYSDDDTVVIPAVFVGQTSGEALLESKGAIVQVTGDPLPQWPSFLVTFIVIIASAILMFTVFMFYRQRALAGHTIIEVSDARLTAAQIARLPTHKIRNGDTDGSCCICLSDYSVGDVALTLPCKHMFHKDCIEPWLTRRNRTCPLCKRDTVPGESTPLLAAAAAAPAQPLTAGQSINADLNSTSEV